MFLVGDVGATSTRLASIATSDPTRTLRDLKIYSSQEAGSFQEILETYLKELPKKTLEAACFAVPGAVIQGKCQTTNLPWYLQTQSLTRIVSCPHLFLMNDVEAHAWSILCPEQQQRTTIYQGSQAIGNYGLVAPGTGLGEAGILWDGERYQPFASEGGHADFAPQNEQQWQLKTYLHKLWGHVSYERVLSGPGLVNLYTFCRDILGQEEETHLQVDKNARLITQLAVEEKSSICAHAVRLFIEILAAEVGNCALRYLTHGGMFLAGGIPHKLLCKLQEPLFLHTYLDKGRFRPLLESISITVIHNQSSALQGAACYLQKQLRGKTWQKER